MYLLSARWWFWVYNPCGKQITNGQCPGYHLSSCFVVNYFWLSWVDHRVTKILWLRFVGLFYRFPSTSKIIRDFHSRSYKPETIFTWEKEELWSSARLWLYWGWWVTWWKLFDTFLMKYLERWLIEMLLECFGNVCRCIELKICL